MEILEHNRRAWDAAVSFQSVWTIPVSPQVVAAARRGKWQLILTPTKPVPRQWFPDELRGAKILCLASGGGQQGPVLAVVGAEVTVFDNSPRQLEQDRMVAEREGLKIRTEEGDMADLTRFDNDTFDLVVHPVSNCFVPAVRPVWNEVYRVLKSGGALLSGFCNPALYLFDMALADEGILEVRNKIPYSDLTHLSDEERQRYVDDLQPLEFGHTLEDQIGGHLDAGFVLTGFYEDVWPGQALSEYLPHYIATRALKA